MNRKLTFSVQLFRNGGRGVAKMYFILSKDNKLPKLVTATFGYFINTWETEQNGQVSPFLAPRLLVDPGILVSSLPLHVRQTLVVSHFLVSVKMVFQLERHPLI